MKRHFLFLFFVFVLLTSSVSRALSLNDVTVLLPLPVNEKEKSLMIGTQTSQLLPEALETEMPTLVVGQNQKAIYRDDLKVVAIRLDPCFVEGIGPQKCRRQIRLIWQPLRFFRGSALSLDAAVHTFYEFDDKSWRKILEVWLQWAQGSESEALQVHPRLQSEGFEGPQWEWLKETIRLVCTEETFVRATFMTVNPFGDVWVFGGWDWQNNRLERISISRLNRKAQAYFTDLKNILEFRSSMNPYPESEREWLTLLSDSENRNLSMTEDEIKKALARAYEFENPLRHNPGTLDCVSCHIAQSLRVWGESRYPQLNFETIQYRSPQDERSRNQTPELRGSNRLRGLGYFVDRPQISQRVIFESIEVQKSLLKERNAAQ